MCLCASVKKYSYGLLCLCASVKKYSYGLLCLCASDIKISSYVFMCFCLKTGGRGVAIKNGRGVN